MPARDFLDKFNYDRDTFDFDQFKSKLAAEIASDDDLQTAALTAITEERDTLSTNERDLKVKLFDATMMKTGTPVDPQTSPSQGSGTAPVVSEEDIFKKVQ